MNTLHSPYHPTKVMPVIIAFIGIASLASAQNIYIDFGSSTLQMPSPNDGVYWNNLTNLDASTGGGASTGFNFGLVTEDNSASGITLTVTDLFTNLNSSGASSPTTEVDAFNFNDLGIDSLYIDNPNPTASFTLTGLDPTKQYSFTIFAARAGVADVRTADYTLTGLNSDTVTLDASNNTSNVVVTSSITPDGANSIVFSMAKAASNTSGSGFAYLGGMQIAVIPEPASLAVVFGLSSIALVCLRRRQSQAR